MDGGGARDHGGDRVWGAVAGVERGAAGVAGGAGDDARVRGRDGAAVGAVRRLLPLAGPGGRPAPQPHLRQRRRAQPRYAPTRDFISLSLSFSPTFTSIARYPFDWWIETLAFDLGKKRNSLLPISSLVTLFHLFLRKSFSLNWSPHTHGVINYENAIRTE